MSHHQPTTDSDAQAPDYLPAAALVAGGAGVGTGAAVTATGASVDALGMLPATVQAAVVAIALLACGLVLAAKERYGW